MGRRLLALLAALLAIAPAAQGARVLRLGQHGSVQTVQDPTIPAAPDLPGPRGGGVVRAQGAAAPRRTRTAVAPRPTVPSVLDALHASGQIGDATLRVDRSDWSSALRTLRGLRGTGARELNAVLANTYALALSGDLTASRLPEVFLTVERNREWWSSGTLADPGQRVTFAGSGIVWEYYPGQGIQLQVLGSFGHADGLYTAGPARWGEMRALIDEMIPLAAQRGGQLAWEYLFAFDGGSPPWVSAMAQGTALEGLTRAAAAARAQGDPEAAATYLATAHSALALLTTPPPSGVGVDTSRGVQLLQYSFAPGTSIINAFLQSLIGLYDYAKASGDPDAAALFARGDAEAQAELPAFDTGAWSLYQPGEEDDLSYHELVTGFLHGLCDRTAATAYCDTARRFDAYMKTPPGLAPLTREVTARRPAAVTFTLSKLSHVGIVIADGTRTVFLTSAPFAYGHHSFTIPGLDPGRYTLRLAATDQAGNFTRVVGSLRALPPPPPPAGPTKVRRRSRAKAT